jgi:hypothetical protein
LKLSKFEGILLIAAAGFVILGDQFSIPVLTDLALLCVGVLAVLLGVEQIRSRLGVYRIGGWSYTQAVETYRGLAAQLWGLIFIGLGVAMVVVPVVKWTAPSRADSLWDSLLGNTTGAGLALAGIGLMTTLHGLIRLLAGSAGVNAGRLTGLSDFFDRLVGAATFTFGLAMALIGIMLLVAAGVLSAILRSLAAMVVGP